MCVCVCVRGVFLMGRQLPPLPPCSSAPLTDIYSSRNQREEIISARDTFFLRHVTKGTHKLITKSLHSILCLTEVQLFQQNLWGHFVQTSQFKLLCITQKKAHGEQCEISSVNWVTLCDPVGFIRCLVAFFSTSQQAPCHTQTPFLQH